MIRSGLAILISLTLTSSAGAGDAAWTQAVVQDLSAPFGIDLSLSGNPFESSVRIPLLGRPEAGRSSLTPV